MSEIRVEMTVERDGTLTLSNLPFRAGETVEVTVLVRESSVPDIKDYPLLGLPVTYIDPYEPVAAGDWESAR